MKIVNEVHVKIVSYNTYGLKSSYGLIDEFLGDDVDIVFICEHWLKPSDIFIVKEKYNECAFTYLKSSMDVESTSGGRPYGGVGWLCKRVPSITYKLIECDN